MPSPNNRSPKSPIAPCFEIEWVHREGNLYVVDLGVVEAIPLAQIRGARLSCREAKKGVGARWRDWRAAARLKRQMRRGKEPPLPRLFRIEELYYVDSGQAAVDAARALGRQQIRARVIAHEPPTTSAEGLVRRERAEFEQRSGLRNVELALAGRYPQLWRNIELHHRYMEAARAQLFRTDQAVADWWQRIYAPAIAGMIRDGATPRLAGLGPADGFCLLAEHVERHADRSGMPLSQALLELVEADLDWREKVAAFAPPCLFGPGCPYE